MAYYIWIPLVFFVVSISGCFLYSRDVDTSDVRGAVWRLLQPSLIFSLVLYLLARQGVEAGSILLPVVIGVICQYTYPVFYSVTQRETRIEYYFPYDFAYGIYVAAGLSLATFFAAAGGSSTLSITVLSLLEVFLLAPVFLQIAYYVYYRECIGENALNAFFQTNSKEAREFVGMLPLSLKFAAFIAPVALAAGLFRANLGNIVVAGKAEPGWELISLLLILVWLVFLKGRKALIFKTGLGVLAMNVWKYREAIVRMHDRRCQMLESLTVQGGIKGKKPGTVLVVIGESANRLHMNAFSDYERDTTPWMSSMKKDEGFFVLKNAYSSWIQTEMAVYMAMSAANQYNGREMDEAVSIVDVAGKCGFRTWWYSNQGFVGDQSNAITLLGSSSDTRRWLLQDMTMQQYDMKLLEYLKRVTPGQDNFVVLHLKGSHATFPSRYPEEFEHWRVGSNPLGADAYDNTIRYTDHVLKNIFEYAKENLNLQAMVYFSDHGSIIDEKRRPSFTDFEDIRVPLCVYLSEEYRKNYPEIPEQLEKNKDKYITNDLVFDLLCGLMHVRTAQYDPEADISSGEYSFTKETLRTNLGKVSLSEDGKY